MEVAATILTIIAATILTIILLLLLIFLGLTLVWKPSPCLKTLGGKHVLITGGSSGIGLAIAKEALSQGAFLTLIARNSAKLEKAIDKLVDNKTISADRIFTKIADVGDYETLADAIEQSFQWRAIDVVVCNAGWARVGYIDEIPIKDLHATINTNLSGMVNTLHVALRLMKHRTNQGHARPPMSVVLVSSLAGLCAQYGNSVYSATKYGVKGLAEALRLELMRYNIGVSVVFPGYVETPMLDECGIETHGEILKMLKVIGMYNRSEAETSEKVAKYILEATKNGTFLVTSQITGLMLSTLSRGSIPADSVGRAFIELVLYLPFRIFSCISAIYVARRVRK